MKNLLITFVSINLLFSITLFSSEENIKPVDMDQLKWTEPVKIKEFSTKETHDSILTTICWSPDDKKIYLQGNNPETPWEIRRFLFNADGSDAEKVDITPPWVVPYWEYKSSLESPDTDVKIKEQKEKKALKSHEIGVSKIMIYRYRFHGKIIAEQKEKPILTGSIHSWAPKGGQAMLYTDREGSLYLVSADGKQEKKIKTGSFTFPAWSSSGKKIAFVKTDNDGTKWTIYIIELEGIEETGKEAPTR